MEYNFEKLTDKIYVCASSDHRFGTDAFLLADFSGYRSKDMACDLGTGCGIIPLIMQKKMPPQVTYAVDIQQAAIEQLKMGMEKSETTGIIPICADLKELWEDAPLGRLDLVTCNPP
jgi:tRNA1(Val) A37 N6-methylase TrmN6